MGTRKIGFGDMLKQNAEDIEASVELPPRFITIIECELCEKKLYYHEMADNSELSISCECEAITCKGLPSSSTKFKNFLAVHYHGQYPKIYDVPYEKHLKTT